MTGPGVCSLCGGVRVDNMMRHTPSCPCYRDTFRTIIDIAAAVDRLREDPQLAGLEADLDAWYPMGGPS